MRPVRSNWLRLRQFSLDVEAAERALAGSLAPAKAVPEPQLLAFQKRGSLKGRIFRVGPVTRELVDLCDGERTVADIAEVASRRHGGIGPAGPGGAAPPRA